MKKAEWEKSKYSLNRKKKRGQRHSLRGNPKSDMSTSSLEPTLGIRATAALHPDPKGSFLLMENSLGWPGFSRWCQLPSCSYPHQIFQGIASLESIHCASTIIKALGGLTEHNCWTTHSGWCCTSCSTENFCSVFQSLAKTSELPKYLFATK